MRPVERGPAPGIYNDYTNAKDDLVDRLGSYCSYCERPFPASLAVEHVFPRNLYAGQALDWDNFLLACVNCNSVKSDNDPRDVFLPDRDNTLLALSYFRGGYVGVAAGMDATSTRRARGLIDLLGLDRHGAANGPGPAPRDERWRQREEIWKRAERCRDIYESSGGSAEVLELVVEVAQGYGFFSVWMTVFKNSAEVKRVLIDAFPGTAAARVARNPAACPPP